MQLLMAHQSSVSPARAARQLTIIYREYRPKLENAGWLARRNFQRSYADHRVFCEYTVITQSETRQAIFSRINSLMIISLDEIRFQSDRSRTVVTDWLLGFRYFLPDDAALFIEMETSQLVRAEVLPWIRMLTEAIKLIEADAILPDVQVMGDGAVDVSRIGDRPLDSILPPNKHSPAVGVPYLIALRRLPDEISLREADNLIHSIATYDQRVFWWDARNLRTFPLRDLRGFPELRDDTRVFVDPVMLQGRAKISDTAPLFYLDRIANERAADDMFQTTAMNTMPIVSFPLTTGGIPRNYGFAFEAPFEIPDWARYLPLNVDPEMVFTMNPHPRRGDPEQEGLEALLIRVARRIFGAGAVEEPAGVLEPDPAPVVVNDEDMESLVSSNASSGALYGDAYNAYQYLPNFPPVRWNSAPPSVRDNMFNGLNMVIAQRVDRVPRADGTGTEIQLVERKVVVASPRQANNAVALPERKAEQLQAVVVDEDGLPIPNQLGIVQPAAPLLESPRQVNNAAAPPERKVEQLQAVAGNENILPRPNPMGLVQPAAQLLERPNIFGLPRRVHVEQLPLTDLSSSRSRPISEIKQFVVAPRHGETNSARGFKPNMTLDPEFVAGVEDRKRDLRTRNGADTPALVETKGLSRTAASARGVQEAVNDEDVAVAVGQPQPMPVPLTNTAQLNAAGAQEANGTVPSLTLNPVRQQIQEHAVAEIKLAETEEKKLLEIPKSMRGELKMSDSDIPPVLPATEAPDNKITPVVVNEEDESSVYQVNMDPNTVDGIADQPAATLNDLGFRSVLVQADEIGEAVNEEDLDDSVSVIAARNERDNNRVLQPNAKTPSASTATSFIPDAKLAAKSDVKPSSKQQATNVVKYVPPPLEPDGSVASERKGPPVSGSVTLQRNNSGPIPSARSNSRSVASSAGSSQFEIQSIVSQCADLLMLQLEEEENESAKQIYRRIRTAVQLKGISNAFPPLNSKLAVDVRANLGDLYKRALNAVVAQETKDADAKTFNWDQFYSIASKRLISLKSMYTGKSLDIVKLQSILSRDAYRVRMETMSIGDALVVAKERFNADPRFAQLVDLFTRDASLAVFKADEPTRAFRRVTKGANKEYDQYVAGHMNGDRNLYLYYIDPRTIEVSLICELLGAEYKKSPSFVFAAAFHMVLRSYLTTKQHDWWFLGELSSAAHGLNEIPSARNVRDSLAQWYNILELLESNDVDNAVDTMEQADSDRYIFESIAVVQDDLFTALKFQPDRFVLFESVIKYLMRSVVSIVEPNLVKAPETNLDTKYKAMGLWDGKIRYYTLREFSELEAAAGDYYVSDFMRRVRFTLAYTTLLKETTDTIAKEIGLTTAHMENIRNVLTECTNDINTELQRGTGIEPRTMPVSVVMAHFFVDISKFLDASKYFEARTRPIYKDSSTEKRKEDQDYFESESYASADLDIDMSMLTEEEKGRATALCQELTIAYTNSGVADSLAAQTIVLKRSRLHSDREVTSMQDRINEEKKQFNAERQSILFNKNRRFLLEAVAIVLKERGEGKTLIESKTSVEAIRVQDLRARVTNITTRVNNLRQLVKDVYTQGAPPAMPLEEFMQLKATAYFQTLNADVKVVVDMLLKATPIDTKPAFNTKLVNRLTEVLRELALLNAVLTDIMSNRLPLSGATSSHVSMTKELLLASGVSVAEIPADDVQIEEDASDSDYKDAVSGSASSTGDLYSIPSNVPSFSSAKLSAMSEKNEIKLEEFKILQESIRKLQENALTAPRLLASNFSSKEVKEEITEALEEKFPGSAKILSDVVKADEAYSMICKQAKDMVRNIETRRSVLSEAASERAERYATPKNDVVVTTKFAVKPPTARDLDYAATPTRQDYEKRVVGTTSSANPKSVVINTDDNVVSLSRAQTSTQISSGEEKNEQENKEEEEEEDEEEEKEEEEETEDVEDEYSDEEDEEEVDAEDGEIQWRSDLDEATS